MESTDQTVLVEIPRTRLLTFSPGSWTDKVAERRQMLAQWSLRLAKRSRFHAQESLKCLVLAEEPRPGSGIRLSTSCQFYQLDD